MSKKTVIAIIIAVLAVVLIAGGSYYGYKQKQERATEIEQPPVTREESTIQQPPTTPAQQSSDEKEEENSELNFTIFNKDKDIWGQSSGRYTVLHWNPYTFTFFNVYRKIDKNTQWNRANSEPLEKPEFFDSDITDN